MRLAEEERCKKQEHFFLVGFKCKLKIPYQTKSSDLKSNIKIKNPDRKLLEQRKGNFPGLVSEKAHN